MDTHLALLPSPATQPVGQDHGARLAQRIFLYAGELYRVPPIYRRARTSQGIAHISHGGKDFVVQSGESINLGRSADVALVSPLRSASLVLELFE